MPVCSRTHFCRSIDGFLVFLKLRHYLCAVVSIAAYFSVTVSTSVAQPQSPSVTSSSDTTSHATASNLCALRPSSSTLLNASHHASLSSGSTSLTAVEWSSALRLWLDSIEPNLTAALLAKPYPQVHERSRLAQVPVVMYHDVLPQKEVFFDITPDDLEAHFQQIKAQGATPITMAQLVRHLQTGMPLPEKPILLTFDDGYEGHYTWVYPLLKKYRYPAVFSVYTAKIGRSLGRSSLSWAQLREIAADPLITIASHSVNHPEDLRGIAPERLRREIIESKRILETELGIPIRYFTYPVGKYDAEVQRWVKLAGYEAALTMNDVEHQFAGESNDLLSIERVGQSQLDWAIANSWGGPPSPRLGARFNFEVPIRLTQTIVDTTDLTLISGGRPTTIHADSRYQVLDIIANTEAIAAVDGGFFSLKYLDSNVMIGPVLSRDRFVPGNASENPRLQGRPLVLISSNAVEFIPFDSAQHNDREGIQADHSGVTDAFVAAAWLVKNGIAQSFETFTSLSDFDAQRHRAFWGIDQAGQPVIGVSTERVDSVSLGQSLQKLGLRDAVMLDSGASTSLAYSGRSLVQYTPRPVPHVVALLPPDTDTNPPSCWVASRKPSERRPVR